MACPICSSELYEKEKMERTSGTFVSIRCTNPECNFFNYETRQKQEDRGLDSLPH
jgi:hypothetical protein